MNRPPSGYFVVIPHSAESEAINVGALASFIGRSWKFLAAMLLLFCAAGYAISFLIPVTYRAQAVVVPEAPNSNSGTIRNQLGGLASLAGIDMGAGGGRKEEYLATLTSAGFARDFIDSEHLLPLLFADMWDQGANSWRAGIRPPTMEAALDKFTREVRTIVEDRKTGIVTITVVWFAPEVAARWANLTVDRVNERLRSEAIREADESIGYLNKELSKTSVVGAQQAIYRLLEDQLNNAMMANVQHDFAFRFIDKAWVPQRRAGPRRLLFALMGTCIGLVLSLIIIYLRSLKASAREQEIDEREAP